MRSALPSRHPRLLGDDARARRHGSRALLAPRIHLRLGLVAGDRLFTRVILPGALPSILVGLRFALGVMWLTLIVAETIGANSGVGYMAMSARELMRTDVVVLSILIYALLGKLADSATRLLERRWLAWNAAYAPA